MHLNDRMKLTDATDTVESVPVINEHSTSRMKDLENIVKSLNSQVNKLTEQNGYLKNQCESITNQYKLLANTGVINEAGDETSSKKDAKIIKLTEENESLQKQIAHLFNTRVPEAPKEQRVTQRNISTGLPKGKRFREETDMTEIVHDIIDDIAIIEDTTESNMMEIESPTNLDESNLIEIGTNP